MVSFWEILDRATNTGQMLNPKEFDMLIFKKTTELVKEYDFRYDPSVPVPSEDGLADDFFEAGLRLYLETGTYCVNSRRQIKFSESEIKEALKAVQPKVLIGEGGETKWLKRRGVEDSRKPLNIGGVIEGNPIEGDMFVKLYQTIAQESVVDGFYWGPPAMIEGRRWRVGTPLEIHAGVCAAAWVREALRRVGRPGLHLISACPSAIADIASCRSGGIRPTDAIALPTTTELKTDYDSLGKVAFSLNYGCCRSPYWLPMVGGYAGGPEGAAIVGVAGGLHAILVYQLGAGYASSEGTTIKRASETSRDTIWVTNVTWNALTRNTKMIGGIGVTTSAGPGTEMMLRETAAFALGGIVNGAHIQHGVRKAVLVEPNQGSGLEVRFMGEVARAAAGLKRKQANEIVNELLRSYESNLDSAPQGKSLEELYDLKTLTPRRDYQEVYDSVKKELEELGLRFEL